MTNDERAAVATIADNLACLAGIIADGAGWSDARRRVELVNDGVDMALAMKRLADSLRTEKQGPAPAAPETVTVEEQLERAQQLISRLCDGSQRWTMSIPARPDSDPDLVLSGTLDAAAKRIAADAQRIAELERVNGELVQRNKQLIDEREEHKRQTAVEVALLRQERDEARRALEDWRQAALTLGESLTPWNGPENYYSMRPAEWLVWAKAATSQGEGPGASVKAAQASEGQAAGPIREAPPSPAPIPLGAKMQVGDTEWTHVESGWDDGTVWYSINWHVGQLATAHYRATHPVADAATVERVALRVKQYNDPTDIPAEGFARIILEELGYTIQEGA